jgi:hypothetical protein
VVPVAAAEAAVEVGEAVGVVDAEVVAVDAAPSLVPLSPILTTRLLGLLLGKPSLRLRVPLRPRRWWAALRLPNPSSPFLHRLLQHLCVGPLGFPLLPDVPRVTDLHRRLIESIRSMNWEAVG